MQSVPVKKLSPGAQLPTYGSLEAAGADLYACLEQPVICLLYTSPSPRDPKTSRMPSSA